MLLPGGPHALPHQPDPGISGGDSGIRGFLAAYDANTGNQVWKFYTTPSWSGDPLAATWGDGSVLPHGGGAMWMTGTFDTSTNTLYSVNCEVSQDLWVLSARARSCCVPSGVLEGRPPEG